MELGKLKLDLVCTAKSAEGFQGSGGAPEIPLVRTFSLWFCVCVQNYRVRGGAGDRPGNHRPVHLTSGVGELLEVSSEDVVGKHLAEQAGFHTGSWDLGSWRPCGTNLLTAPSSACPHPGSAWPGPMGSPLRPLKPIRSRAEESEDQIGRLREGRGRRPENALALEEGFGEGNIPLGRGPAAPPRPPDSLHRLRRWVSGASNGVWKNRV